MVSLLVCGSYEEEIRVAGCVGGPFLCPTYVMEKQGSEIAALHDAVKALTAQVSELQLQCMDERPLATQQQWSEVVRNGRKGKGKDRARGDGVATCSIHSTGNGIVGGTSIEPTGSERTVGQTIGHPKK